MTGKKKSDQKMSFTKVVGNFTYQLATFFHEVKKVIKSKKDFNKSCPKFCKLGDDFFILTKYKKCGFQSQKNVFDFVKKNEKKTKEQAKTTRRKRKHERLQATNKKMKLRKKP